MLAHGVSRGESDAVRREPRNGAKDPSYAPSGAARLLTGSTGLTPWVLFCRPHGLWIRSLVCLYPQIPTRSQGNPISSASLSHTQFVPSYCPAPASSSNLT